MVAVPILSLFYSAIEEYEISLKILNYDKEPDKDVISKIEKKIEEVKLSLAKSKNNKAE